jgi:hypothetical protein
LTVSTVTIRADGDSGVSGAEGGDIVRGIERFHSWTASM